MRYLLFSAKVHWYLALQQILLLERQMIQNQTSNNWDIYMCRQKITHHVAIMLLIIMFDAVCAGLLIKVTKIVNKKT